MAGVDPREAYRVHSQTYHDSLRQQRYSRESAEDILSINSLKQYLPNNNVSELVLNRSLTEKLRREACKTSFQPGSYVIDRKTLKVRLVKHTPILRGWSASKMESEARAYSFRNQTSAEVQEARRRKSKAI